MDNNLKINNKIIKPPLLDVQNHKSIPPTLVFIIKTQAAYRIDRKCPVTTHVQMLYYLY